MSNLVLNACALGSDSDTDDEDFVPEGKEERLSEEEDSEGGEDKKESSPPKEYNVKEKKETDSLWADFMSDVKDSKTESRPVKKPSTNGCLGSFSIINNKKSVPKKTIKKQTTKKKMSMDTLFDLSSDFKPSCDKKAEAPKSIASALIRENGENSKEQKDTSLKSNDESASENPQSENEEKIKITQVFDFAGESVEVTKEIEKDSKEAKKILKSQEENSSSGDRSGKRPGGLGSIMGVISGKKPKIGCLDKSKMDWDHFVKKEGIKEELNTFNKGKDGYVEKQMFLERTDLRRFEIEKAAREKTRKPLTGRSTS